MLILKSRGEGIKVVYRQASDVGGMGGGVRVRVKSKGEGVRGE